MADIDPVDTEAHVKGILQPLARARGAELEGVDLRIRGADTSLEVTVDRRDGTEPLTLDEVAELSRVFSDALDASDPIESAYELQVSTPGAESELKEHRHYQRNVGRQLRVKLKEGEKLEGLLTRVGEDTFTLDTPAGSREVAFDAVRKARPRVTFR